MNAQFAAAANAKVPRLIEDVVFLMSDTPPTQCKDGSFLFHLVGSVRVSPKEAQAFSLEPHEVSIETEDVHRMPE